MTSSNEQLFKSVFNCATFPMVLVKGAGADYTIISSNEQHEIISNKKGAALSGLSFTAVFESEFDEGSNDFTIFLNSLSLAQANNTIIQIPVLNFSGYSCVDDSGSENLWRIEVVPVSGAAQELDCLLLVWHRLSGNLPAQGLNHVAPVVETTIGEALAATGEQIELGNEEMEAAAEELEAVNNELVQVQEDLNKLNQELEQTVANQDNETSEEIPEVENQRDRLRRFLMQASAGICILDGPDFILEFVNPSFFELFPQRDLLSRTFLSAFPEIQETEVWNILKEVYRTGETFQGNEWLVPLMNAKDQTLENRYFNFIYQARYDSDDKIDGIMIFVYEVTDMVLVRLEVEENERRFRLLLNAIPQIAWTNTADGEVSFFNAHWYTYTGISFEQSQGMDLSEVVHPDDLKHHQTQFSAILESENSGNYEIRKKGENGEYRWYLIHMQPIKDESDQLLLWIGTATDIDDLKLLQQKKDDLINIASHELKTPIASLKASMQLLHRMKHNSSEKMQNLIELAGRGVDKVSGLITDLLDPNQLNEGGLPLRKTTFSLFNLIEDCCRSALKEGLYNIVITGDKDLMIDADAERIAQVITNMVTNATKYAPESKVIHIYIEKLKDSASVSVADQGPGIPADKIPFLFDRYYRVGCSKQPGLGLGLYISAGIIAKHNGQIGAESTEGRGSRFWFTLPCGAESALTYPAIV